MNSSRVNHVRTYFIGTKWKDRAVPKCCRYPTCSAPRDMSHSAALGGICARSSPACSVLARSLRSALMTIYSDFVRLPHCCRLTAITRTRARSAPLLSRPNPNPTHDDNDDSLRLRLSDGRAQNRARVACSMRGF